MRRIGAILAGLVAALISGGCGEAVAERGEVGSPVPHYGAVDLKGDSVHLRDLREKVVLLNVWATWCEPCREEIPALQALHERHSPHGFEVVGVSIDFASERDKLRPFADSYGVTYTILHDTNDTILRQFRVVGAPSTFLIDREGIMRWKGMGAIDANDPGLAAAIEAALADS